MTQFLDRHRLGYGILFIYTAGSAASRTRAYRHPAHLVRRGYIVAFLVDADTNRSLEVEFLGERRGFDPGGERLAQRTRCPLAAAFITRTARGHLMEIQTLPADQPTQAFVKSLEERIRARPDQYVWVPHLPASP